MYHKKIFFLLRNATEIIVHFHFDFSSQTALKNSRIAGLLADFLPYLEEKSFVKNRTLISLVFLSIALMSTSLSAQSKLTYNFKKGTVVDILLGNTKPESVDKQQLYFKEIFPVAQKLGYNNAPALGIPESPIMGNYHPQFMAFGLWKSFQARTQAMETIEEKIPDIYQRRKDIWSTFNMTSYELDQDINLELSEDKTYVVTACWLENSNQVKEFKNNFSKEVSNQNGKVILELMNGRSPVGYYYNPDYFTITEWDNSSEFQNFVQSSKGKTFKGIKNINQFKVKSLQ